MIWVGSSSVQIAKRQKGVVCETEYLYSDLCYDSL